MLDKNELLNIYGGGLSAGTVGLIIAGVIFIIGALDGFIRPLKCNALTKKKKKR